LLRHCGTVAAGAEHAIEGAAGDGELLAAVGGDDLSTGGRGPGFDAGQIVGALGLRRRREEKNERISRPASPTSKPLDGHVEVEVFHRARYCTASTRRRLAPMPSVPRFLT
jgi:hypothetical protein